MDINQILNSFTYLKPEIALVSVFGVVLLVDLFFGKENKLLPYLSILGALIVGVFLFLNPSPTPETSFLFMGLMVVDNFGTFFKALILLCVIFILIFSLHSDEIKTSRSKGEFYVIILGMTLGMFLMSSAYDLLFIYLAMETVSISSYILSGFTKEVYRSSEASLKYLIFGATASAMMLYGISILFGITGSTNIFMINNAFRTSGEINMFLFTLSGLLIIAGIGFKVSMVPFHFWTPDVYEGSPITVTALLSVASKAAGFAILIRFFTLTFVDLSKYQLNSESWIMIIALLSVLSMTIGNLVAIWQNNLKRMLAYSSIAHAGYMLMGIVILSSQGIIAILLYFVFYLLMNLGAFYAVMLIADKIKSEEMDDFKGLGYRSPFVAIMLTIFLISLAGIPPTAGFIGKLYLFAALIQSNWIWLAVIGVLNSVISLYYYVRVVRNMFLRNPADETPLEIMNWQKVLVLLILGIPTIVFGLYFKPIADIAQQSIKMFGN